MLIPKDRDCANIVDQLIKLDARRAEACGQDDWHRVWRLQEEIDLALDRRHAVLDGDRATAASRRLHLTAFALTPPCTNAAPLRMALTRRVYGPYPACDAKGTRREMSKRRAARHPIRDTGKAVAALRCMTRSRLFRAWLSSRLPAAVSPRERPSMVCDPRC